MIIFSMLQYVNVVKIINEVYSDFCNPSIIIYTVHLCTMYMLCITLYKGIHKDWNIDLPKLEEEEIHLTKLETIVPSLS